MLHISILLHQGMLEVEENTCKNQFVKLRFFFVLVDQ